MDKMMGGAELQKASSSHIRKVMLGGRERAPGRRKSAEVHLVESLDEVDKSHPESAVRPLAAEIRCDVELVMPLNRLIPPRSFPLWTKLSHLSDTFTAARAAVVRST